MEKYIDILKSAKEKNEKIEIREFLKKCKEESGIEAPTVMKEVIKKRLDSVLVMR